MANENPAANIGAAEIRNAAKLLEREIAAARAVIARMEATAARSAVEGRAAPVEGARSPVESTRARAGLTTDTRAAGEAETAFRRTAVAEAEMGRVSRSTGALNAEFFRGLASGNVTLAEVRTNMGETIAKFGGWTLAAAAVFVAVDAIKALADGAKDSASHVQGLSRFFDTFDRDKAARGFRDVSKELNVPVGDVGQAQENFARYFKNQDDSLTAARVSLTATKLDNISLADSYKYLLGITQEWGLNAKQLPGLFDQISAAQRRTGARVSEVLPALARSSSAVKNAGGDMSELLAQVTAAQVGSGQTGPTVGTAFSRAASNFFRRPDNKEILRSFGIDPNQGFTNVVREAVEKTKGLSGEDRTKLARAIAGPQYGGRIFQSLLNNEQLLNKARRDTSPEQAKGSANDELRHKLQQVDEQMQRVVNTIGRLGATLGSAGAFSGFGALLKLTNLLLTNLERVVDVINQLPPGIRPFVTGLLEAYAVLRLLRGTRIGEGLAARTGIPGLSNQRAVARREDIASATGRTQFFGNAATQQQAQAKALAAASETASLEAQTAAAKARALPAGDAKVKLEAEKVKLEKQAGALLDESAALEAKAVASQRLYNAALLEKQALQQTPVRGYPRQGARPVPGATPGGRPTIEPVPVAPLTREARQAEEQARRASRGAAEAESAGARARQAVSTGAQSIKGAGRSIGRFVGGLGLLGNAFLTFTIVDTLIHAGEDMASKAQEQIEKFQAVPENFDALNARIKAAHDARKEQLGAGTIFDVGESFLSGITGTGFQSYENARRDAAASEENALKQIKSKRKVGPHGDRVGFTYDELLAQFQQDTASLTGSEHDRQVFLEKYAKLQENLTRASALFGGNAKDRENALKANQAKAREAQAKFFTGRGQSGADPFAAFKGLNIDEINKSVLDPISDRTGLYGPGKKDLAALTSGFVYQFAEHGRGKSQATIAALQKAQQDLDQYVNYQTQDLLQAHLAIANTPQERQSAFDQAIAAVTGTRDKLESNLKNYQGQSSSLGRRIARLQKEKAGTQAPGLIGPGHVTLQGQGIFDALAKHDDDEIAKLQKRKDAIDHNVRTARKALTVEEQKLAVKLHELKTAKFQDLTQSVETSLALQQSQTQDNLTQANEAVGAYSRLLNEAAKLFGRESIEYQAQLTKLNQASQHVVDVQRSRLEAFGKLRTSATGSYGAAGDLARSRSDIQTLQDVLAFDTAHRADPAQIAGDQAALNDALRTYAQNAAQYARDLRDSIFERRISQTDDPIQKARLALQRDRKDLQGLTGADRNRQLGKIGDDQRSVWDAIFSDRLGDAQFLHDTAQLTDQAYVNKLKEILRLGHVTKQQRQQLLREIYQVEHQDTGNLELNYGDIKLPTTYEVRRALKGGLDSPRNFRAIGAPQATVNNTNTFAITVARGQEEAMAQAIATALDGSTNAALRAVTPGSLTVAR